MITLEWLKFLGLLEDTCYLLLRGSNLRFETTLGLIRGNALVQTMFKTFANFYLQGDEQTVFGITDFPNIVPREDHLTSTIVENSLRPIASMAVDGMIHIKHRNR